MTEHGNELRRAAETLRKASHEINLALEQCTRPRILFIRVRRSVVQASRAVVNVVDLGFHELCPGGASLLSKRRHPDRLLGDDAAFSYWKMMIAPSIRVLQSNAKADAGAFDFSPVKTDGEGRILGRDGKPLTKVEVPNGTVGGPVGWRLSGPAARASDDYDEVETLEHLRCQAADWVDACDVAVDLIRKESTIANNAAQGDDEVRTKKSRRRGDAQVLIIAALTAHHEFDGDGRLNLAPIGVNDLADLAKVSSSTVSLFFQNKFAAKDSDSGEGLINYKAVCRDKCKLLLKIEKLNGDNRPPELWNPLPNNHGDDDRETATDD